jgi:hypothetical protein
LQGLIVAAFAQPVPVQRDRHQQVGATAASGEHGRRQKDSQGALKRQLAMILEALHCLLQSPGIRSDGVNASE